MIKNVTRLNGANKGSGAGSSCDAKHFPDLLLLYTPSLWDEEIEYAKLRSHRVFKEADCNDAATLQLPLAKYSKKR